MLNDIQYPLILDGGLSAELEKQGCDLNHPLWSAHLIATNPEAIVRAHTSYLEAGAQCLITSSYQASVEGFRSMGYNQRSAERLISKSIRLAELAIENYRKKNISNSKIFIAASIGPYGAFLADGSEYHGKYEVPDAVLYDYHQSKINLLAHTNADFLACETIPSFREAKVIADVLKKSTIPAWVSFSCKDDQCMNDGTLLSECLIHLAGHPNIFAVGVNCTPPNHVSSLIEILKKYGGEKKLVVYPNSGESYDAGTKKWAENKTGKEHKIYVKQWLSQGVDIIGGCCRIDANGVSCIRDVIDNGFGAK